MRYMRRMEILLDIIPMFYGLYLPWIFSIVRLLLVRVFAGRIADLMGFVLAIINEFPWFEASIDYR